MSKSIIIIEEETIKGKDGKTILKRTIRGNILNRESILYQDEITPKKLHNENTPLNIFERWVVKINESSNFNKYLKDSTIDET